MVGMELFVIICLAVTVYIIINSVKKAKKIDQYKKGGFPKKKALTITIHLFNISANMQRQQNNKNTRNSKKLHFWTQLQNNKHKIRIQKIQHNKTIKSVQFFISFLNIVQVRRNNIKKHYEIPKGAKKNKKK